MKRDALIKAIRVTGAMAATMAVALAIMVLAPAPQHEEEPTRFIHIQDVPIVDYPQYRELMREGEVYVRIGDETAHLVKSELGWQYLQRLGLMVRAE